MEDERFDGLYLSLAQQLQGIDPLMNSFFSFLRRKTDFFAADSARVEEVVLAALRRQSELAHREEVEKEARARREEERRLSRLEKKKRKEEEAKKRFQALQEQQQAEEEAARRRVDAEGVIEMGEEGGFYLSSSSSSSSSGAEEEEQGKNEENEEENEEEESGDGGLTPNEGNGYSCARYSWTQTLSEVSIQIPMPSDTPLRGRDVQCTITPTSLSVGLKGREDFKIEGSLPKRINSEDSLWTLEDGRILCISLLKENKMEWWRHILQGEPEIDVTKVQPENSQLSDLDPETRQTVEKMMFDQNQKARGLPTSDEMQKQEVLARFMREHPEMDFTNAKIG